MDHLEGDHVKKYFFNIDILRIVAAISVVVFHLIGEFTLRPNRNIFLNWIIHRSFVFASGVDLFFVISGFVIVSSLESSHQGFSRFLKSRIRRIVPIYWLLIAFTLLANFLTNFIGLSHIQGARLSHIFLSMFFLSTYVLKINPIIQQGWTLEYEIYFYIVVALTLLIKRSSIQIPSIILILGLSSFFIPNHLLLCEFIAGMVVALIKSRIYLSKRFSKLIAVLGLLWLVGIFFGFLEVSNRALFALPYSLLLLGLVTVPQVEGAKIIYLGAISYPLYLGQGLVIPLLYQFIKRESNPGTLVFGGVLICGVLASLLLAAILYRVFDRPINLRLRRAGW
jgi:peptidoglycan/LPS O-acetylase OafA/YrhL